MAATARWKRFLTSPPTWIIVVFYLLTHLVSLTLLPVFADEAIYIRWSQLIVDDWQRYLFFPLNDGKTPLFMWSLVPLQWLDVDQLWAARLVSVVVGLGQVLMIGAVIRSLRGSQKAAWLGMFLTCILPYWYFHHRMALTDGMLALWLTVCLWGLIKFVNLVDSLAFSKQAGLAETIETVREALRQPKVWVWGAVSGIALGLALLTKVPAVLFIPIFTLVVMLPSKLSWPQRVGLWLMLQAAAVLGLVMLATLRFNPAFGQLFSRGSDFLFPWREVLLEGKWTDTLRNFPSYFMNFIVYLSWPVCLLTIAALFSPERKKVYHFLFLGALSFLLPIGLLGRVVYPRYLLPVAIWLTISAALYFEELVRRYLTPRTGLKSQMVTSLLLVLLLVNIVSVGSQFMLPALTNANQIPFLSADREQYLTEWSSGHGITPTVDMIKATAATQSLAVATEGYFGTLPDGVLMYLHGQNVEGIYVEGIGQPVRSIPASFKERATQYNNTWLVVNSHRLDMQLDRSLLLQEYCRPYQAPCLQVWDITSLVK